MKYTLIAILLLTTISGMAQSKKNDWVDMQVFRKGDTAWVKGDTIVFSINTTVKFIQIGEDIYQVVKHNPTIEKVEPPKPAVLWQNGFVVPANAGSEIKY